MVQRWKFDVLLDMDGTMSDKLLIVDSVAGTLRIGYVDWFCGRPPGRFLEFNLSSLHNYSIG